MAGVWIPRQEAEASLKSQCDILENWSDWRSAGAWCNSGKGFWRRREGHLAWPLSTSGSEIHSSPLPLQKLVNACLC